MKARCLKSTHKNWTNYGGRGITVCQRWLDDFQNFWNDMSTGYQDGLTLERINNSGNYEPGNCKWATRKEQNNNTRANVIIPTPWGPMTVAQAGDRVEVSARAIAWRKRKGWSEERILKPARPIKRGGRP